MIQAFIKKFTDKPVDHIVKRRKECFLTNKNLEAVQAKIPLEPFAVGLYLGQEGKTFQPSPALIDILSKKSKKKTVVEDKAEWLFLCGKNVIEYSILKGKELKGTVFVQNRKQENLGYGLLRQEGKKKIIKNVLDKGAYLRMER